MTHKFFYQIRSRVCVYILQNGITQIYEGPRKEEEMERIEERVSAMRWFVLIDSCWLTQLLRQIDFTRSASMSATIIYRLPNVSIKDKHMKVAWMPDRLQHFKNKSRNVILSVSHCLRSYVKYIKNTLECGLLTCFNKKLSCCCDSRSYCMATVSGIAVVCMSVLIYSFKLKSAFRCR